MLLKLLTLLGVLLTLYGLARRAAALFGGAPPRGTPVTDMVRCGACGAWHETGQRCRCAVPPTP
jgi:hypothetical protein